MLSLSAVILVLLLICILLNVNRIKEFVRCRILLGKLPTADGKQWVIGHAGKFFGKTPEVAWILGKEMDAKCGPVYTLYMSPFVVMVGVSGAEELEATIASTKNLEKSRVYAFLHRWLEEGLLTSTGSKWQKRRKILTPAFHFSILLQFMDTFNRETDNFVREIENKYLSQPIDIVPLISTFTLLTMSETSMGTKLDLATTEGMEYKKAIYQMEDILYERVFVPWLWFQGIFDLTPLRKLESLALKVLHNFTANIIDKRSKTFKTYDEKTNEAFVKTKQPLLDVLLNAKLKDNSIDDKGIREEVDTFMFEGHDTTATCISFTTMLFACHENIQDQVYQEIVSILGVDLASEPTYNDLQQMTLLERCIKESLRLYPPVPLISRKFSDDVPTKYGTIPKGAHSFYHIYNIHRDPTHWPDPDVFDPSRHTPENSCNRHPFAFVPFSAGPRNCIGQRFAMLELKAFFCGLLRKFKLEPIDTPESIVLVEHLVLRTLNGIKVKFVLRNNKSATIIVPGKL